MYFPHVAKREGNKKMQKVAEFVVFRRMHVANLQFMWQNRPFERCLSQELFAILPNASNASAHFQTE